MALPRFLRMSVVCTSGLAIYSRFLRMSVVCTSGLAIYTRFLRMLLALQVVMPSILSY